MWRSDRSTTSPCASLYARSAIVVVPLADVDFQAGVTTILEAMAMGKPVIVTHSKGQTDVVEDRRIGDARQPAPLASAVSFTRQLAQELGHPVEPTGFYVPPADPAALRQRHRRTCSIILRSVRDSAPPGAARSSGCSPSTSSPSACARSYRGAHVGMPPTVAGVAVAGSQ